MPDRELEMRLSGSVYYHCQFNATFPIPVPPFDFNAITIDLAAIKTKAQHGADLFAPNQIR